MKRQLVVLGLSIKKHRCATETRVGGSSRGGERFENRGGGETVDVSKSFIIL